MHKMPCHMFDLSGTVTNFYALRVGRELKKKTIHHQLSESCYFQLGKKEVQVPHQNKRGGREKNIFLLLSSHILTAKTKGTKNFSLGCSRMKREREKEREREREKERERGEREKEKRERERKRERKRERGRCYTSVQSGELLLHYVHNNKKFLFGNLTAHGFGGAYDRRFRKLV